LVINERVVVLIRIKLQKEKRSVKRILRYFVELKKKKPN